MSVYQRLLGHPFVYDRIRPLIIGGLDMSTAYENLMVGSDDIVLDIGCGTGDGLNYVKTFRSYHGFDVDPVAIEAAQARAKKLGLPAAHFETRYVVEADLAALAPTRVMLAGLLHHLADDDAVRLLRMIANAPSVKRIATSDIVYLPGRHISNLLAFLDRGRHCRRVEGYRALIERSGLRIATERVVRSHPVTGRAEYLLYGLEPIRD